MATKPRGGGIKVLVAGPLKFFFFCGFPNPDTCIKTGYGSSILDSDLELSIRLLDLNPHLRLKSERTRRFLNETKQTFPNISINMLFKSSCVALFSNKCSACS